MEETTERTITNSKKFIAFFFSSVLLTGVLVVALFTQAFNWPLAMMSSLIALGLTFISIGYILSQNALDKFVRGLGQLKGAFPKGKEYNDE